jgi:ABC-type Mn2+/Zn2+ transport system ATPase subunit
VIELVGVRKRHRRAGPWVLDGIDLTIGAGRVVQVVGTNGSGKSTLVRIAATLARPTQGVARVHGAVRFVPELTPPPPPLTVRAYLAHQVRLQGVPAAGRAEVIDDAVAQHRLGPTLDRPMRELSKGWGQRVVLAQAFLTGPAVVVLDEPFSGVDAASREHLLGVVEAHAREGAAVLITSHEAMAIVGLERRTLVGGRFTDPTGELGAGAERVVRRVVLLRRRPGAADLPDDLQNHSAVERIEPVGAHVPGSVIDALGVLLDADAGDDFLARALDGGWTVERLETRFDG